MNTSLPIISRHTTLSEAVQASGIDLSYNPEEANRRIREIEGSRGGEAFVTAEGVYFLYRADIVLLNKFSPFSSVMDDFPFRVVTIENGTIRFGEKIAKTATNRLHIKARNLIVG